MFGFDGSDSSALKCVRYMKRIRRDDSHDFIIWVLASHYERDDDDDDSIEIVVRILDMFVWTRLLSDGDHAIAAKVLGFLFT